jgi:hypothetical protein
MSASELGQQALRFISEVRAEAEHLPETASARAASTLDLGLLADLTAEGFDTSAVTERLARRARHN